MRKTVIQRSVAMSIIAASAGVSHAALLSINTSGLSTNGSEIGTTLPEVLYAWNLYGNSVSPATVNGIEFVNASPPSDETGLNISPVGITNGGGSNHAPTVTHYAGNPQMQELMSNMHLSNVDEEFTVTISGLTDGQRYDVSFIHHMQVSSDGFGNMELFFGSDDTGSSGGAFDSRNSTEGGYITVASFTADGTTQDFYIDVIEGTNNDRSAINAILVQTVPEPSSTAILGLGLASLALRRRRRQA